jgi:hypothetical protein
MTYNQLMSKWVLKTFTKLEAGKMWFTPNVPCLITKTNNKVTIDSQLL